LRAAEYVKFQKRCDDASLSGFYVLGIPWIPRSGVEMQ
jgi:hypothetical protein